jgi:serine/threonine protein kinase
VLRKAWSGYMEWLHAHGILHGDLKAANCLLTVLPEGQDSEHGSESALLQGPDSGPAAGAAAAAGGAASYKLVPKVTDFGLSR